MKDSKQMYAKFIVSCLIIKTESDMRFCVIEVIIKFKKKKVTINHLWEFIHSRPIWKSVVKERFWCQSTSIESEMTRVGMISSATEPLPPVSQAGNGIGANPNNILEVLTQYRGLSWR